MVYCRMLTFLVTEDVVPPGEKIWWLVAVIKDRCKRDQKVAPNIVTVSQSNRLATKTDNALPSKITVTCLFEANLSSRHLFCSEGEYWGSEREGLFWAHKPQLSTALLRESQYQISIHARFNNFRKSRATIRSLPLANQ